MQRLLNWALSLIAKVYAKKARSYLEYEFMINEADSLINQIEHVISFYEARHPNYRSKADDEFFKEFSYKLPAIKKNQPTEVDFSKVSIEWREDS